MKTTEFTMMSDLCNASEPDAVEPYVIISMQAGSLPIEIFRQLEQGGGSEASETPELTPTDEPLFGTHIKEAIDVLRGRRK